MTPDIIGRHDQRIVTSLQTRIDGNPVSMPVTREMQAMFDPEFILLDAIQKRRQQLALYFKDSPLNDAPPPIDPRYLQEEEQLYRQELALTRHIYHEIAGYNVTREYDYLATQNATDASIVFGIANMQPR